MEILKKRCAVMVLIFFVLIGVLILISYDKFHVFNPLSSGIGLIRINATDISFVKIQNFPRVVLAKSDNAKDTFLKTL